MARLCPDDVRLIFELMAMSLDDLLRAARCTRGRLYELMPKDKVLSSFGVPRVMRDVCTRWRRMYDEVAGLPECYASGRPGVPMLTMIWGANPRGREALARDIARCQRPPPALLCTRSVDWPTTMRHVHSLMQDGRDVVVSDYPESYLPVEFAGQVGQTFVCDLTGKYAMQEPGAVESPSLMACRRWVRDADNEWLTSQVYLFPLATN